jgi:hypothetical protein
MRIGLPGRPAACLALALLLAAPAGAAEADVPGLLARIQKVGREGAGNPEAARAWKELVARGPAVLPTLLGAMDDENAVASNWLRAAVDAVGEKAVRAGRPLPKAELEKFVAQTKHARVARRLAYEWLCQVDKTAPDRLLPKMIQDPSPELRRDAVARVLDEADKHFDKKDAKAAVAAYRKALSGACDRDQVDRIAERLDKLGVKVDLASHFGFVRHWHLVAPFDNRGGAGFDKAYPPERGVDLSARYKGKGGTEVRWAEHTTNDPYGLVDLNKALARHKGVVAYAYAVIDAPEARPVEVRLGSITSIKVFLNGKQIFARDEYHHGMQLDQYVGRGALKAGRNELLVKVCQNEQTEEWAQAWTFQARLCDVTGAAVPFKQAPAPKRPAREVRP